MAHLQLIYSNHKDCDVHSYASLPEGTSIYELQMVDDCHALVGSSHMWHFPTPHRPILRFLHLRRLSRAKQTFSKLPELSLLPSIFQPCWNHEASRCILDSIVVYLSVSLSYWIILLHSKIFGNLSSTIYPNLSISILYVFFHHLIQEFRYAVRASYTPHLFVHSDPRTTLKSAAMSCNLSRSWPQNPHMVGDG